VRKRLTREFLSCLVGRRAFGSIRENIIIHISVFAKHLLISIDRRPGPRSSISAASPIFSRGFGVPGGVPGGRGAELFGDTQFLSGDVLTPYIGGHGGTGALGGGGGSYLESGIVTDQILVSGVNAGDGPSPFRSAMELRPRFPSSRPGQ
jgi:hypothetical protein